MSNNGLWLLHVRKKVCFFLSRLVLCHCFRETEGSLATSLKTVQILAQSQVLEGQSRYHGVQVSKTSLSVALPIRWLTQIRVKFRYTETSLLTCLPQRCTIGENNRATRYFLIASNGKSVKLGPQITKTCDRSKLKDSLNARLLCPAL